MKFRKFSQSPHGTNRKVSPLSYKMYNEICRKNFQIEAVEKGDFLENFDIQAKQRNHKAKIKFSKPKL